MSIIHTYLTHREIQGLCQRDMDYLRRKLKVNCLLNTILHRPINRPLLDELQCILDGKALARRKTEQYRSNGEVKVYIQNELVRILHCNGKVMKEVANASH